MNKKKPVESALMKAFYREKNRQDFLPFIEEHAQMMKTQFPNGRPFSRERRAKEKALAEEEVLAKAKASAEKESENKEVEIAVKDSGAINRVNNMVEHQQKLVKKRIRYEIHVDDLIQIEEEFSEHEEEETPEEEVKSEVKG